MSSYNSIIENCVVKNCFSSSNTGLITNSGSPTPAPPAASSFIPSIA
jgi:hypothetical protein